MPRFKVSDKEIKATMRFRDPDWRVFKVEEISKDWEKSKSDTNIIKARFVVVSPKESAGVTVRHVFPQKNLGESWDTLIPFANAFMPEGQELKDGDDIDTDKTRGLLFEGWSYYNSDGDYPGNVVTEFRRHKAVAGKTA